MSLVFNLERNPGARHALDFSANIRCAIQIWNFWSDSVLINDY
jgi:hypothetical protein